MCASAGAQDVMPAALAKILKRQGIAQSQTGIYISRSNGEVIAALNLDAQFNPASTIKAVTSMAALDLLGPQYVWSTRLLAAAPIIDDNLRGDLFLQGNGDPYMTVERLLHLVTGLRLRGLQNVAGDLVIDDRLFVLDAHDPSEFDGAGTKPYNGSAGANVVNFGSTQIIIRAASNKIDVLLDPPSANFTIENKLKLRRARCNGNWRSRISERLQRGTDGSAVLTLGGSFPSGCGEQSFFLLAQSDPNAHIAGAFMELFALVGGNIEGGWRVDSTPRKARKLNTIDSVTLGEALRGMNKFSNNVMARNIFLSLAKDQGKPYSLELARTAVAKWFGSYDIGVEGLYIENGSGLSRNSRISPRQFGNALVNFYRSPYRNEFIASLAILGRDGTARNWNRRSASAGKAHIKTGTLSNARATVGYVHNAADDLVFVMMFDTGATAAARRAIQQALEWCYSMKLPVATTS